MKSTLDWRTVAVLISAGSVLMTNAETLKVAPVQTCVFENGLTLLVREDHSAPVVSVQAWVRAGSITEGKWLGAGLSHVLEHMLFKGTKRRGVAQIAQEVEDHGGRINAYTSFEHTVYYIDMPAEHWPVALDILTDCMFNATIPEEELAREKEVILREMDMNRDDPNRRAQRLLWSTAYTIHPYQYPVIGYRDVYERTTRDDLIEYYRQFYVPNNIVFAVVGDVSARAVEERLRELTRSYKRAPLPTVYVPAEPPQLSPRRRFEQMAVQLSRTHWAWHVPAATHPDVYALDVLAIILGQGRSSRLYRELQEKRGLVHGISASCYTPAHPGLFIVSALVDADKRDEVIAAVQEQIQRLQAEPVSDDECQKAVKTTLSHHIEKFKTMEGQADDIASSYLLTGDPQFSERYVERVQQVRPADIQRVAQTYLRTENVTITSLDPLQPTAAPAAATPSSADIRIEKIVLANGLRLLVREDPKLPYVDIHAVLKGGVLAEDESHNGVCKLTARMLLKGTASRSAQQIADEIESVGGQIRYFAGNNSFGISAHALSTETERALALVADVLQNPSFPEDMLAREREVQLAEIKTEQDQIFTAAQQLLRETLYKRHPYRLNINGKLETVSQLTRTDLVAFHQRYVVASNLVLAVFGNVKATDVLQLVQKHFGQMPTRQAELPAVMPEYLEQPARADATKPKEQAVLLLGFHSADLFSPDRYALELLDEAYSGMGSRLFRRLRDQLGLCYYVGAYQRLGLSGGYFVFYVGTTPQNLQRCEEEFFAELAKLGTEGLEPSELARAQNSLIGQRRLRMQDNAELSQMVALDELYGLGYDFYRQMETHYRAVTTADIQRVARTYFTNRPYAIAVVRPESTKE